MSFLPAFASTMQCNVQQKLHGYANCKEVFSTLIYLIDTATMESTGYFQLIPEIPMLINYSEKLRFNRMVAQRLARRG